MWNTTVSLTQHCHHNRRDHPSIPHKNIRVRAISCHLHPSHFIHLDYHAHLKQSGWSIPLALQGLSLPTNTRRWYRNCSSLIAHHSLPSTGFPLLDWFWCLDFSGTVPQFPVGLYSLVGISLWLASVAKQPEFSHFTTFLICLPTFDISLNSSLVQPLTSKYLPHLCSIAQLRSST